MAVYNNNSQVVTDLPRFRLHSGRLLLSRCANQPRKA